MIKRMHLAEHRYLDNVANANQYIIHYKEFDPLRHPHSYKVCSRQPVTRRRAHR